MELTQSHSQRIARVGLFFLLLLPLLLQAGTVTVVVKKSVIRADKAFYAASVKKVKFGDKLEVLKDSKGWLQVKSGGSSGWIHQSAVSDSDGSNNNADGIGNALGFLAGKSDQQGKGKKFSEDEVALAGKGFNQKVEGQYRNKNPGANFAAVDAMERRSASAAQIASFVSAGGLQAGGGSAPIAASSKTATPSKTRVAHTPASPPKASRPAPQKEEKSTFGSFMDSAGDFLKKGGDNQPADDDPFSF